MEQLNRRQANALAKATELAERARITADEHQAALEARDKAIRAAIKVGVPTPLLVTATQMTRQMLHKIKEGRR